MPEQGRVGDKSNVPADSHGCPGCPHSCTGPAVAGSPNVIVNGQPALRIGDPGVHAACCGPNTWNAAAGAPGVFFNDIKAHRKGDKVQHCGGSGKLIEGSPNVIVGDYVGSGPSGPVEWTPLFDGGFQLLDEEGEPLPFRRYLIHRDDGTIFEGRSDKDGLTRCYTTEQVEGLVCEVLEEDETMEEDW